MAGQVLMAKAIGATSDVLERTIAAEAAQEMPLDDEKISRVEE